MFFRRHGETSEQFHEQPKDEEFMEKFQYHRKVILTILKTSVIESETTGGINVPTPSIVSRNSLWMLFKNTKGQLMDKSKQQLLLPQIEQECIWLTDSEIFENNVEAKFSLQQRWLFSEITSDSAQALEAQRHTRV